MNSEKFTKATHLKDELYRLLKNLEKKVSSDDFSGETFVEAEHELANLSEEIKDFGLQFGGNDPDFIVLNSQEEKLSKLIKNNELMAIL